MPFGSGLSGQVMVVPEVTVGTPLTPTTAYEFLNEGMQEAPSFLDGSGLKASQQYKRAARTVIARKDVNGSLQVEHSDQGHMGLLWKHALGSTISAPTQIAASTAYKQIHTPGSKAGLGLTVQVGRPSPSGTVNPFTYAGCKVTQWDFSCVDNQYADLKLTLDGWTATTATGLATASYTATAGLFNFADAGLFKLGGTASTAAGETTVSTGVTVASVVKGITISGVTPLKQDRYGLGNSGTKREQIENAIPTITGSLDAELTNLTEFYNLFPLNTTTVMQIDLSHGDAGSGNAYLLSFIFPAVKFKLAAATMSGPDVVPQKIDFEAYDDGSGTNPVLQVKLVSKDTTL